MVAAKEGPSPSPPTAKAKAMTSNGAAANGRASAASSPSRAKMPASSSKSSLGNGTGRATEEHATPPRQRKVSSSQNASNKDMDGESPNQQRRFPSTAAAAASSSSSSSFLPPSSSSPARTRTASKANAAPAPHPQLSNASDANVSGFRTRVPSTSTEPTSHPSSIGVAYRKGKVGVLPLQQAALEAADDGRAVVWLDIDNTLYRKSTRIAELMTERIRAYFLSLGLSSEEAERLHGRYYKEYGLAIRGLVMHHKIDALDYDAKCDAALPLERILRPEPRIKALIRELDRSKCRVWALTNAYKTHAVRVLKLLDLHQEIEGIVFCDYAMDSFACKPERNFYEGAMDAVGMHDPSRCYFVDDSALNIRAARALGWKSCVLFQEQEDDGALSADEEKNALTILGTSVLEGASDANGQRLTPQAFENEKHIFSAVRGLPDHLRQRLLNIVLDACMPRDIATMRRILDQRLERERDHISSLPVQASLRIFERLSIKELLRCRQVSREWNTRSKTPSLWRSHALALTEGDVVSVTPPSKSSEWELLAKGLYFRERNWTKGVCQSLTMMHGHTGFVTAMKLKGKTTLVTGSYDETIRVWDLHSGVCRKVLKAKAIACLDFLADEGILAAGLYDSGRVMVWDMRTWTLLQTLNGHNKGVRHVSINSDYLVSVGQDKAIVVWDWQTGTKIVRFGQQSNVSLGVSIVDHDKLVAVTVDGIIRTFDLASSKKDMIGQFDVKKLSPALASRLGGLKDGTNMLQWFAAHGNTITLGSHNFVIHLRWQEHDAPPRALRPDRESLSRSTSGSLAKGANTNTPLRTRKDSASSVLSSSSSMSGLSRRASIQKGNGASTPKRHSVVPPLSSNSPRTPVKTAAGSSTRVTPSPRRSEKEEQQGSGASAPSDQATTPQKEAGSTNREAAADSTSGEPREEPRTASSTGGPSTRVAPNLAVAPMVVSVVGTADSAVGCVDAAKQRIVCASRFSSRPGADRRLYTTTFGAEHAAQEAPFAATDSLASPDDVVPIGGAWQAAANELATPGRNPMSLVLDPDHCVVGTNSGLVYTMSFVGSQHTHGWADEIKHDTAADGGRKSSTATTAGEDAQSANIEQKNMAASAGASLEIPDLMHLRHVWAPLFVKAQ